MATDCVHSFQQLEASLPSHDIEESHRPVPKLIDERGVACSLGVSVQVHGILVLACLVHLGERGLLPSIGSGNHDLDLVGNHRVLQYLLDRLALLWWTNDADTNLIEDIDKAIIADRHHVLVQDELPVPSAVDMVVVDDFHWRSGRMSAPIAVPKASNIITEAMTDAMNLPNSKRI